MRQNKKGQRNEFYEPVKKEGRRERVIVLVITFSIILIPLLLILSFWVYMGTPEYKFQIGADIEKVSVSEDSKSIYIRLNGGINQGNITKVIFNFEDKLKRSYPYETQAGKESISVPLKITFIDWITGEQFTGGYDYEITSEDIGIADFSRITNVGVSFEYEKENSGALPEKIALDSKKIFFPLRK
jgi:hypothetical protein